MTKTNIVPLHEPETKMSATDAERDEIWCGAQTLPEEEHAVLIAFVAFGFFLSALWGLCSFVVMAKIFASGISHAIALVIVIALFATQSIVVLKASSNKTHDSEAEKKISSPTAKLTIQVLRAYCQFGIAILILLLAALPEYETAGQRLAGLATLVPSFIVSIRGAWQLEKIRPSKVPKTIYWTNLKLIAINSLRTGGQGIEKRMKN